MLIIPSLSHIRPNSSNLQSSRTTTSRLDWSINTATPLKNNDELTHQHTTTTHSSTNGIGLPPPGRIRILTRVSTEKPHLIGLDHRHELSFHDYRLQPSSTTCSAAQEAASASRHATMVPLAPLPSYFQPSHHKIIGVHRSKTTAGHATVRS